MARATVGGQNPTSRDNSGRPCFDIRAECLWYHPAPEFPETQSWRSSNSAPMPGDLSESHSPPECDCGPVMRRQFESSR